MADGFDEALIGYGTRFTNPVAVYDYAKAIELLTIRDGMSQDEAEEFFEFNVAGAYVGEQTPVWLREGAK